MFVIQQTGCRKNMNWSVRYKICSERCVLYLIVAICDDEPLFRQKMKAFLIEYKKSCRTHFDIVEFPNGEALLNYKYPIDIVFLDYEMPYLNGMETARRLRAKNNICCIIFITSFPEHVFEAFEVNTYRYILKPVDFNRLEKVIDNYIRDRKMLYPILVNIDGEQLAVSSKDVIYLEADGRYCNIRTVKECLHSSKTLAQVYELLPKHCFYRTHKSYAVNFYCINSIKENTVLLTNGEKVTISRNNISPFKNAYKEFVKHFVVND